MRTLLRTLAVGLALLLPFVQTASATTTFRSAALTTTVTIKSKLAVVFGWHILNTNASVCSVDLFNAVSGSVTLGTTVPAISITIPSSGESDLISTNAIASFPTALSAAAVTAAGGASTCATGVVVNLFYQ